MFVVHVRSSEMCVARNWKLELKLACIRPLVKQMAQCSVEGSGDGIIFRPIGSICVLVEVQGGWQSSLDIVHNQPLQAFHNYRCQCNGTIIIEGRYNRLLWH